MGGFEPNFFPWPTLFSKLCVCFAQALRQYQQVAVSGLHNGLDSQQLNPALAPFMMMSHPALFSSGIPPTSMAMLNHINQVVIIYQTVKSTNYELEDNRFPHCGEQDGRAYFRSFRTAMLVRA